MNEPIVFKRSVLVGQLVLVQVLVPPLLAIGSLYGLAFIYGAQFGGELRVLSVLVAILSPMVFKRPEMSTLTILPRWGTIAFSLMVRWLVLLAILFAIGYATKTSEEFPRRVVLTWAFVTPIPLIFVSIGVNEIVRRFMLAPSNIRTAVVAGYNDVSQVLLQRIQADPGLGLRLVGFFDDRSVERLGLPANGKLLGGLSELPAYVQTHKTDVIFISLLLIGLLIKLGSPGPIIFRQRRYGLDGQIVDVYKFRTMTVTEDGARIQQATRNDVRITPIGKFLRRYSIDELPQLINVLEGS